MKGQGVRHSQQVHLNLPPAGIQEGRHAQTRKDHSRKEDRRIYPKNLAESGEQNLIHLHLGNNIKKLELKLDIIIIE